MTIRPRQLTLAAVCVLTAAFNPTVQAETIFGLTTTNSISVIDSTAASTVQNSGAVTGLAAGENLIDIDYRPGADQIYGLSSFDNVYTIDRQTFGVSLVGNFAPPSLVGNSFAFDFNNAFDGGSGDPADIGRFARIISDTDNNRVIDGNTGQYLGAPDKTAVFYEAGDVNEGADPNVVGIAYTNAVPNAASTQQYGIDRATASLVTVANNAGTLETVGTLGVNSITDEAAFDISAAGTAFAVLQTGATSELFTIDLGSGSATSLGDFGDGSLIRSLTAAPAATAVPEPGSFALLGLGAVAYMRRKRRPQTA